MIQGIWILVVFAVVALVVARRSRVWEEIAMTAFLLLFGFALLSSIVAAAVHCDFASEVEEFKATKHTIIVQRKRAPDCGRLTMVYEIIRANNWLAVAQDWNAGWWLGPLVPDEVDDLEPIR